MILFVYHALVTPITIDEPVGMLGMFMLSWFSGVGIGMMFLAATPGSPSLSALLSTIYRAGQHDRLGQDVAGQQRLPYIRCSWFDWNPLFHTIDQGRGFIFLNYTPHYTSIEYPI